LAAFLAQKRLDRCRQTSSRENLSSAGNQADVIGAASGKTSPDASDPRTDAIMDDKVASCPATPLPGTPHFFEIHNPRNPLSRRACARR